MSKARGVYDYNSYREDGSKYVCPSVHVLVNESYRRSYEDFNELNKDYPNLEIA